VDIVINCDVGNAEMHKCGVDFAAGLLSKFLRRNLDIVQWFKKTFLVKLWINVQDITCFCLPEE